MPEPVQILIEGQDFDGWKSFTVDRSVEAAAGSCELSFAGAPLGSIRPGHRIRIGLQDRALLTGYLDAVQAQLSQRAWSAQGRDATADLVDCSAMNRPDGWARVTLNAIVSFLAGPFDLPVRTLNDPGEPFPLFKIQPGETAWEAIERACRLRGFLAFPDGAGGLVLWSAPARERASVQLVEGRNVQEASIELAMGERFQRYTVRGQGFGVDELPAEYSAGVEGKAFDLDVQRRRELLVLAEGAVVPLIAQLRAEWEATVRKARSTRLQVTVPGWREQARGPVWDLARLVSVRLPSFGLGGWFLISAVRYSFSPEAGATTDLTLTAPDAYLPQPDVAAQDNPFQALIQLDQSQ